jgi:glycosyltransferase involved in cell wall biosynthesis
MYFACAGHDVSWLSFQPLAFQKIENVHFLPLQGPFAKWFPPAVLMNAYRVRRLLAELQPEIVHAHYAGLNGVVGALAGCHPLVVTAWGSDVLVAGRAPLRKYGVRMALAAADLITCDAEHLRRAMMAMGIDAAKIARINFGSDLDLFKRQVADPVLREKLGIRGGPVVISMRNLYKIYNVELLLKAVPFILDRHKDTQFVIIGSGPEAQRLKDLAEAMGVAQSVRFVGRVAGEELPAYLSMADIYVSTALSDGGLAASTAEAMACELPVVVTDSGENRDWVTDGENGFVVSTDDATGLAKRISMLLEDEPMRKIFGERNRQIIAERNSFETEMQKMEELYRQMLKA